MSYPYTITMQYHEDDVVPNIETYADDEGEARHIASRLMGGGYRAAWIAGPDGDINLSRNDTQSIGTWIAITGTSEDGQKIHFTIDDDELSAPYGATFDYTEGLEWLGRRILSGWRIFTL